MGLIERWKLYVCACGYRSTMPGRCRSHPYPARAMGPEMEAVEVVRASDYEGAAVEALEEIVAYDVTCDDNGYIDALALQGKAREALKALGKR